MQAEVKGNGDGDTLQLDSTHSTKKRSENDIQLKDYILYTTYRMYTSRKQ